MNECRLCGKQTDSETLLCESCTGDLKAGDAESVARFDKGFIGMRDNETGLSNMLIMGSVAQQTQLLVDAQYRCPTCGRMDHCCCKDCPTCVGGIPMKHKADYQ